MSVDAPRRNKKTVSSFINSLKGKKDPATSKGEGQRRLTSAARWTDFAQVPMSPRQVRRIRERDYARTTKKFHGRQKQQAIEVGKHNERVAVKVLSSFEQLQGLEPGGLRQQLIDDGALQATAPHIIGWETEDMLVPNAGGVAPTYMDVRVPITVDRPVGHTPSEILAAAGLTPEKIQELNEQFASVPA